MSRTTPLFLLFALALAPAAASALDEGKLEPAWFGSGMEFRQAEDIDYLWVKPGFSLDGKRVEFSAWQEPAFRGEKAGERDTKDKRLANDLTGRLPGIFADAFRNAFGGRVEVVDSNGAIQAVGRIVDCSTGSAAAKFWVGMGAGAGSTTMDLKFVDAASGELLVALHHRVVSGTTLSTTESKLTNWIDELAEEIGKKGIESLYQKGKRVKE